MEIGNIVKLLLIAAVCLLSVLANGKKNRALRRSRRKVRLLSALANGKKKKPRGTGLPLPQAPQEASHPQAAERKRPLGFAIPHLKGAPQQPPAPDDDGVYREQAPRAAGEQARPSAAPAQPAPRGRVLGDADVSVDDAGVMREPGVLASEEAERLREQAADDARAAAYARERRAEEAAVRAREAAAYAQEAKLPGAAASKSGRRHFTPQTAREAVVLAAIIGPPKAFRSRGWRGGRRT
ncbi:MAG: hypothetical protein MR665_00130 [Selenomonas bovis]|nr:hypothetical protein [Selenomonas bovis]